jgi:hypothetical protein
MKARFRLFRRGNYFWSHDGETGKQETLRTKDKATALRLLHSKNEAYQQPIWNCWAAFPFWMASSVARNSAHCSDSRNGVRRPQLQDDMDDETWIRGPISPVAVAASRMSDPNIE